LTDGDSIFALLNFYPQIIGERTKVTHTESSAHLLLEAINDLWAAAGDDQVIDIYCHDQSTLSVAVSVNSVLRDAAPETK
jgi:hypothetical protein